MNNIYRFIFWPAFFIAHLLAISLISWHLLAQVNFQYSVGYTLIGIEKHVQEFAPRNNFKQGFQHTTPADHWKIFAQITDAIQHHGKGLADITYKDIKGTTIPFMHKAEIIHLQDVANLIDKVYVIGFSSAILWIGLFIAAYKLQLTLPVIKHITIGFIMGITVLGVFVVSFGATKIFYWLHTKIFPDGHQWFFYYEDSLMTTLMKAPDIFAFIALHLTLLLLTLWALSIWLQAKILLKNSPITKKATKSKKIKK